MRANIDAWFGWVKCDNCKDLLSSIAIAKHLLFDRCGGCKYGDYDLCKKCYAKGHHKKHQAKFDKLRFGDMMKEKQEQEQVPQAQQKVDDCIKNESY